MSELFHKEAEPQLICWDRSNYSSVESQLAALKSSRTVYVGNLSFFTTEQQIMETFSTVGPVKRLIMGVNSLNRTPCGFCFVEYYNLEHYHAALKVLNESVCDDRVIRCDADAGFMPGRQFGRGKSGGQFRDERRTDFDPARGRFVIPELMQGHGHGHGNKRGRDRDQDDDEDRGGKYGRRSYPQREVREVREVSSTGGGRGGGGGERERERERRDRDSYGGGSSRTVSLHAVLPSSR